MLWNVKTHYTELINASKVVALASVGTHEAALTECHADLVDLYAWHQAIDVDRPESVILAAAIREYQFALLAGVTGQYRQAFFGLRAFMELSLAACFFSGNEFAFREWQGNGFDIRWSSLNSDSDGVLSNRFVRCFFPGLEGDATQLRSIADNLYRECSEYVHSNWHTITQLPSALQFDEATWAFFLERVSTAVFVVQFGLCSRYLTANPGSHEILEPVVMQHLGMFPAIRSLFGGVVDNG